MQKVHILEAEHFSTAGRIVRVFATEGDANRAAAELTNQMMGDTEWFPMATMTNWTNLVARLQDHHGAAHCYVEVREAEIECQELATADELFAAREEYADENIQVDEGAAVSRADNGAWVAAWVWVADDEEDGEHHCSNCGETTQDGSGVWITCGHTDEED